MARLDGYLWLRGTIRALVAPALGVVVWVAPGLGAERLPIFDTHVHRSRDVWDAFPPAAILEKLDAAAMPRSQSPSPLG